VVVINSSVGLQAIARKLPTVVFGESFYTRDEIAFVVHDLAQAAEVVARAAQGLSGAMLADIDHFVAYLRNVHFIQGGWASPLPGTIVQTVRRLAWLAKSSPRQTPLVMPSA
jgi:capsular polysaccharide export protein